MRTAHLAATVLVLGCTTPAETTETTESEASSETAITTDELYGIPYTPKTAVAACTAEAVLATLIADAQIPTPAPPVFLGFWASVGSCEPTAYSAALGTSYVRCAYEDISARPSAIRHYVGTAFYFCNANRYRLIQGAITQHVTANTDLVMLASGGWYEDGSSYDSRDCYVSIKSDGRAVSGGLYQCFRDRAPMHRTGNALVVASSNPDQGSTGYRLGIFEENKVTIAPAVTYRSGGVDDDVTTAVSAAP